MKEKKLFKIISIIAFFLAVLSISIGFATLTSVFFIDEKVTVNPHENFLEKNMRYYGDIYGATSSSNIVITSKGETSSLEWKGINIAMNETGKATLMTRIINESIYNAYLTKVYTVPEGINANSDKIVCVTDNKNEQKQIDDMCKNITFEFSISSDENFDNNSLYLKKFVATSLNSIDENIEENVVVPKKQISYVKVEINYNGDNKFGGHEFKIYIPTVKMNFSSVKVK